MSSMTACVRVLPLSRSVQQRGRGAGRLAAMADGDVAHAGHDSLMRQELAAVAAACPLFSDEESVATGDGDGPGPRTALPSAAAVEEDGENGVGRSRAMMGTTRRRAARVKKSKRARPRMDHTEKGERAGRSGRQRRPRRAGGQGGRRLERWVWPARARQAWPLQIRQAWPPCRFRPHLARRKLRARGALRPVRLQLCCLHTQSVS